MAHPQAVSFAIVVVLGGGRGLPAGAASLAVWHVAFIVLHRNDVVWLVAIGRFAVAGECAIAVGVVRVLGDDEPIIGEI
ncbi:MAG: hypothetical protein IPK83_17070 [Planctomycetes bacterium]|nr:hypothetical protein [Planctomycetota bacterium]